MLDDLDDDLLAAKASIKAKMQGMIAAVSASAASFADVISTSLNSMLSFLPQVQQYLRAEWIQYIGLSITAAAFFLMLANNKKAKDANARASASKAPAQNDSGEGQ